MENKMKFLKLKKEEAERVSGGQDFQPWEPNEPGSQFEFQLKGPVVCVRCEKCNWLIEGTQAEIDEHISRCGNEYQDILFP